MRLNGAGWHRGSGLVALVLAFLMLWPAVARADEPRLILGTTIDLQRTGLLEQLVPAFEQQSGRIVTVVAVSAPHALALGVRAELDVLLADAGDDEPLFMAAGHGVDRQLVMHADEVIVGPRADPAALRQSADLEDGLQRIARTGSPWVSRADNSALYQTEKRLWRDAGIDPVGQPWYLPFGQGMLPTLAAATEHQAYTLVDRRTFLDRQTVLDLEIQRERAPELLRLFHVIVVDPAKGEWIDEDGAREFAAYVLGPEAQEMIRTFGLDHYGQAIFVPDAGRTERELRPNRRAAV